MSSNIIALNWGAIAAAIVLKGCRAAACGTMFGLFGAINVLAQYSYTTLSMPGAEDTYATGISSTNIVGYYFNGTYNQGFFFNGTTYTTLNFSGASDFEAYGISGNNIVGAAIIQGHSQSSGFLYNGSYYSAGLSVPNADETWFLGISGNNCVGYYFMDGTYQGFIFNINTYTYTSLNVGTDTFPEGISGTNIVGYSSLGGFIHNNSGNIFLNVPGAASTTPFGISSNNVVVGGYYTGSTTEGFIYNGTTYTTLNVPGSVSTCARGIYGNNIVGYYENTNGVYFGFRATPVPQLQCAVTNHQFQISVSMMPPASATMIQVSTDLANWRNVYTNTPPFTFTDSVAASPVRFYRAILGP